MPLSCVALLSQTLAGLQVIITEHASTAGLNNDALCAAAAVLLQRI